jgi:hypothetical protein
MTHVRINLMLTPALLSQLDRLAKRIGLDRTNTIRYCIARTFEAEAVPTITPPRLVEPKQ